MIVLFPASIWGPNACSFVTQNCKISSQESSTNWVCSSTFLWHFLSVFLFGYDFKLGQFKLVMIPCLKMAQFFFAGPDNLDNLRKLAEQFKAQQGAGAAAAAQEEDDENCARIRYTKLRYIPLLFFFLNRKVFANQHTWWPIESCFKFRSTRSNQPLMTMQYCSCNAGHISFMSTQLMESLTARRSPKCTCWLSDIMGEFHILAFGLFYIHES